MAFVGLNPLFLAYAVTAGLYVAFVVYGYRAASGVIGVVGITFVAAIAAVVLIVWITLINFVYLLMQIAMAADNLGLGDAFRAVVGFVRAEFRVLAQVFLVILGLEVGATLVSALAWSGLLIPAALPFALWLQRRLNLRPHDQPPRWSEIILHLVAWSVAAEDADKVIRTPARAFSGACRSGLDPG